MTAVSRMATVTVLALGCVALSRDAQAESKQSCSTAYDQAQTFRDDKKLTEARDQLRVCGQASCPPSIVKDCTAWLADLDPRIPTVVAVATDAAGAVLANVVVTVDGGSTHPADGTAVDVDPGPHTFTFTASDGARAERRAVIVEGQKAQRVAATLETPPAASPPSHRGFPYKPMGYTLAGVGAAGLVVGTIAGVVALSTKSSDCPTETTCKPGTASTALTQGTVSTIGFVAGGVLAAAGVTLLVIAPKGESRSASLAVAPVVGARDGGLAVVGRW